MRRGTGRIARAILVTLDGVVAVTAVSGGVVLAAAYDRFPDEWLAGTPFNSYVVPGLILALMVGGSAAVAALAWLRSSQAGSLVSVLAGYIMMGWVAGEMLILHEPTKPTWFEALYFIAGLMMTLLGLALTAPINGNDRRPLPGAGRSSRRLAGRSAGGTSRDSTPIERSDHSKVSVP